MCELPLEILQHIFKNLHTPDILQCQYTCKLWYIASVELLYSKPEIKTLHKSGLFIRTISTSPQLAKLTKDIYLELVLSTRAFNIMWDTHDLLSHLLQHCPNILRISLIDVDLTFWIRLTHASYNGQLTHLQALPQPSESSIESYVYTALAFKKTLTDLILCDQIRRDLFGERIDFRAFQTLAGKLNEFPNLKNLWIVRHTTQSLPHLDSIIQRSTELITLDITSFPLRDTNEIEMPMDIVPRYDIKKLKCQGKRVIDSDKTVDYIMKKFPSLTDLTISHIECLLNMDTHIDASDSISPKTLIQFFQYMSHIPTLNVDCIFKRNGLIDTWIDYMKMSDSNANRRIRLVYDKEASSQSQCMSFTNSLNDISIIFPGLRDIPYPVYIELIKKGGELIYKLNIENMMTVGPDPFYISINQVFSSCPNLKDLVIKNSDINENFIIDDGTSHDSLESLTIIYDYKRAPILHRETLDLRLPKLKYLFLSAKNVFDTDIIKFPDTNLDLLVWKGKAWENHNDMTPWVFYIKLHTINGVFTMYGDLFDMYPCAIESYTKIENTRIIFRLNIECLSISELRIVSSQTNFIRKYILNEY